MSASLLISSPSVVISAGLATTIALYLKIEKKYSLQSIFSVFLRRYALFGLVCLVYYFTYLKNGNSPGMQDWWKEYFFPTSLSAWPEYVRTVYFGGKSFPDFSVWLYIKLIVMVLGFLLLSCGSWFLWRKNRFILLALLTPFGFAAIAAFFFYPLLLGASVRERLSLYLVPLLILLMGQALLPLMDAVLARISRKMLLLGACSLITAVLCINVVFAVRGMGHEQISPLISSLISQSAAEDIVMVSGATNPVWEYYTLSVDVDLPVVVLPSKLAHASDDELGTFFSKKVLSGKKTLYILYTFIDAVLADRVKAHLEKRGWRVEVCAPTRAQVHKVVLQEAPSL